jgi:hypothetical protein
MRSISMGSIAPNSPGQGLRSEIDRVDPSAVNEFIYVAHDQPAAESTQPTWHAAIGADLVPLSVHVEQFNEARTCSATIR